jgi:hypothetical protein
MMQCPAPRRRLQRWLNVTGGAVLLLLAAHAGLWWWAGNQAEQRLDRWAAARRAEGWEIAHAAAQRAGWPLRLDLTLPQLRMVMPLAGLPGGLAWQTEQLRIRLFLTPWNAAWREADAEPLGAQRVQVAGQSLPLRAEQLRASIPVRPRKPDAPVRLMLRQLRIGEGAEALLVAQGAGRLEGRILNLELRDLTLPGEVPLGPVMASLTVQAALIGPAPDLGAAGPPPAARAAAWRDGGGELDLRSLFVQWGGLSAGVTGRISLDAALQPQGEGRLLLVNPGRGADALADAGFLAPRTALLARGLLPLLARPDPSGGPPRLDVPVQLRDRTLLAAGLTLLRLPVLSWSQGS